MRKTHYVLTGAGVLLILLSATVYTQIQVNRDKEGFLEGRNWKDGSVVVMTFIRTQTGQDLAYLDAIANTWKKQQEALKAEGIIESYKVWQGNAASETDFNIILMTEYKNFRVMEENADKQTVILQTIAKETQASAHILQDDKVREFFGVRTGRTIVLR
jgi:hypothetical protein